MSAVSVPEAIGVLDGQLRLPSSDSVSKLKCESVVQPRKKIMMPVTNLTLPNSLQSP